MLRNLLRTRILVGLSFALVVAGLAGVVVMLPGAALVHRFYVGQRLVFRLEYLSASGSNFAGLAENAQDAKDMQAIFTNVEADLQATVIEANADGAWIALTLKEPTVQVVVNGELAMPQGEAIQADLSRTMLAFVEPTGRIGAVHLDSRINSLSHSFARALLATTQVVLPSDAAKTAWETTEQDPNGEYGVRYQRGNSSGNVATLTKERTHYKQIERVHSIRILDVNSIAKPSGQLTVRFDESAGHVVVVDGQEATTIHVDAKTVARVETKVNLRFLRAESLTADQQKNLRGECASLKEEPALTLSTPASSAAEEAIIYRNELGDATVETILDELTQFDGRADANESDTALYFRVKALVYLHPEACPQLAKALIATKSGRAQRLLVDALSSIGHASAQSALQSAIRASGEDAVALAMLVPALAMVEMPTVASETALRDLAASSPHATIRAAAELGLGTMAHQLAGASPERSRRIAAIMADKLRTAKNDEERRHLLFVLGNAGDKQTLDVIVPFVKDAAPEVRSAAVAALRWIKAMEVDGLLCMALANDADAGVRLEAATSLGFRKMTPETFGVQRKVFREDASSSVRVAVLQNLARSRTGFPEVGGILTQAMNDPVQDVREEATNLLAIEK